MIRLWNMADTLVLTLVKIVINNYVNWEYFDQHFTKTPKITKHNDNNEPTG